MLKPWIEHIKKEHVHYGVEYWKYHTSNNMLELSVKKEYTLQENDYREAIISIGKVLQALRQKMNAAGMQHHIQSFPNLDDSCLVAAIRIFSSGKETPGKAKPVNAETPPLFIVKALKNYAADNHLFLHKINQSNLPDSVIPSPGKKYNWYALCADHDNPFTWLRVGYWQEYLETIEKKTKRYKRINIHPILVTDTAICNTRGIRNGSIDKKYVQLLVGIPAGLKQTT